MRTATLILSAFLLTTLAATTAPAAELARLNEKNWDDYAPAGKEVDAIYGDYVLRNGHVVAVIAQPLDTRNANLTVHQVGGCLIDLTRRDQPNDQLSALWPYARRTRYNAAFVNQQRGDKASAEKLKRGDTVHNATARLRIRGESGGGLTVNTTYALADGDEALRIVTRFALPEDGKAAAVELVDSLRADRTFEHGYDEKLNLFWVYDRWFDQCYGFVGVKAAGDDAVARPGPAAAGRTPGAVYYEVNGQRKLTVEPGKPLVLSRVVIPGRDVLQVKAIAARRAKIAQTPVALTVRDADGPVADANVIVNAGSGDDAMYGRGKTDAKGRLNFDIPPGEYAVSVSSIGRPRVDAKLTVDAQPLKQSIDMQQPGYVVAHITDAKGGRIPCKVQFIGKGDTRDPYFFHDTGEHAVGNLYYSHDGKFRQAIAPGEYRVTVSYGPEYDAIFTDIDVKRGEETKLTGKLERTVNSKGWVSAEYHSHSSPSGDNTSSQYGRVLNLLCEHLEFAPCTEHQRIDTYVPHLKRLNAMHLMATCSGMELTGRPGDANHQNAFPLHRHPHTQDGGAPTIHDDPRVQIERLAYWDDGSDKLVQQNHPNIIKALLDRDLDGKHDGGFGTFGFMDVIELHPPDAIFAQPQQGKANRMINWMQMINQGMYVPGVVNTDAHYNFHGSGWLRNYIKSSTDDPAKIDTMEMVHESEHGHIVMSTGPFMEVKVTTAAHDSTFAIPGDKAAAPGGKASVFVKVQCPNWFDINRVQLFVNGRMDPKLNFTRKTHPKMFGDKVVKFEQTIDVTLEKDAHIIVAAIGEGLGLGEVMGNSRGKIPPVAVSNPIFLDVDGGGFKPNGDTLGVQLPLKP